MNHIQILGIRKFTPKGQTDEVTYDAFHDKDWRAPSIPQLFKEIEKYLEQIPQDKRWNLFYTVANCGREKRDAQTLGVIVFDVDGIKTDDQSVQKCIEVVLKVLKVPREKVGIVFSGNGLHFVIQPVKEIKNAKKYVQEKRGHYGAVRALIDAAVKDADLIDPEILAAGKKWGADPKVWDARRIMRLPGTVNRKPNKPEKQCQLIERNIEPLPFDLVELSGLPEVKTEDQVGADFLKKYPKIDEKAVLEDCAFLQHCEENADILSEPEWYAWLSIVGKFEQGRERVHDISSRHPGYSAHETDLKMNQALSASGPRTCENINAEWGSDSKCTECPHFKKILSPISITGEDFIGTETTGFHSWGAKAPKPNYEDLRRAFERDYNYKNLGGSRMTFVWKDTHYVEYSTAEIEGYAQDKFNPRAKTAMRNEFKNLIQCTNIVHPKWFAESIEGKMNFANGVLDLETMELSPHSPDYGFRHVLPFAYDPTAKCPNFDKMMTKVTSGDVSRQTMIKEFGGYGLSGDKPWLQKCIIFVGDGSNGKSTVLEVIQKLVPDDAASHANIADLNKSEYTRQTLDGKLFNISEETPTRALMDSSLFKTLVTGGRIMVRGIYKEPYYTYLKAKMYFSCNELPEVVDTTHGLYRRLLIVPFDATFSKDDPDYDPFISDKLEAELPGIFNSMIKAYKEVKKRRAFTESEVVNDALKEFKADTDTVGFYFGEHVHVNGDMNKMCGIKDLYQDYRIETEGMKATAVTRPRFTRILRKLIPDFDDRYSVCKIGESKNQRVLKGVTFSNGVNDEEPPELDGPPHPADG